MSDAGASLWLRLKAEGLVDGELPSGAATGNPWFVRVMLGVAAWISALFLLIFVGFLIGNGTPGLFIGLGLVACAVAAALLRQAPEHAEFVVQGGLAVSLAGQGMVLIGLSDTGIRTSSAALVVAGVQAVLFVAASNNIHRVWSAGVFAASCVVALADWQLHDYATGLIAAGCAWIWLHEFQYAKHGQMVRSCGYGLTLALIGTMGWFVIGGVTWASGEAPIRASDVHRWIGPVLSAAVLIWAVRTMLAREAVEQSSRVGMSILSVAGIVALATLKAPGLAPAVLILLLGHGNGNLVLLGLGVASLLGYMSFYYYSLETTLLYKSVVMAATGLGLLVARLLLQRVLIPQVGREDDQA